MRFCIGFMFQNNAPWLELHLPLWSKAITLHGMVAVDGGSTDGSAHIARAYGVAVVKREFDWHFAAQGNALIEACEQAGYDTMLRLDPDEAMLPADVDRVGFALDYDRIIALPRYNFVKDRYHYNPEWYPDFQRRGWRLNAGVRYPDHQRVHEVPEGLPTAILDGVHIYHYGWIDDPVKLGQKSVTYARLDGQHVDYGGGGEYPPHVPFPSSKPQPQDPAVIGARAPLEPVHGAV